MDPNHLTPSELTPLTRVLLFLLSRRPDVGNIDLTHFRVQAIVGSLPAHDRDTVVFEGDGNPTPRELDANYLEFCYLISSDD